MAGEAAPGGGGGGGAGAGLYMQAMVGVIDLLAGGSRDAAYDAAYGQHYRAFAGMHNAARQAAAAGANIAAIRQDTINTDTVIKMKQDQAEAMAKVAAAVSGVEGQSVNDVIYQTEVNSSVAQRNAQIAAEQNIENQLSTIYTSKSTMLALDNPASNPADPMMAAAQSLAHIVGNDELRGRIMEGWDSMFGVNAQSSVGDIATPTEIANVLE